MSTATLEQPAVKAPQELKGDVYCPMCTHTVSASITKTARGNRVAAGQRCPRCSGSLDAGYVIRVDRAA